MFMVGDSWWSSGYIATVKKRSWGVEGRRYVHIPLPNIPVLQL
jgi:hypothetical protein